MTDKQKSDFAVFRSIIAIALALLLPVGTYLILGTRIDHNARSAFIQSCEGNNQTRQQTLAFIDSSVTRSENNVNATLHAPSSTADQKRTAVRNLAGLKIIAADAHKQLTQKSCVYPPVKETP